MGEPLKVGIIGLGKISGQYLTTIDQLPAVQLVAVADLDVALARQVAAERERVRACSVAELLAADEVELVVNLTVPAAHADIALQAVAAGKGVYGEKPLALDTGQAAEVLSAAAVAGVPVGCAPDTVLGTGIQTARKGIDDGLIGRPIAATATMVVPGHERWHPNPDFYYQPGGGPLLDIGPYYLTALVTLLGPVTSVVGMAGRTRDLRVIGSGARAGQEIPVDVDTHITGVLTHSCGVLTTLVMSFDAVATRSSNIEIHGELATMAVPDPNHFAGQVHVHPLGAQSWAELPVSAGYAGAGRGIGIADLAATPPGELPRAGGALAFHVLDVMESILRSVDTGRVESVASTATRPAVVPLQDLTRAASLR